MFKRIGLLVLANLAVFIMLSVILTVVQMVFGVNFGTMAGSSLNLSALFIYAHQQRDFRLLLKSLNFFLHLLYAFFLKITGEQNIAAQMILGNALQLIFLRTANPKQLSYFFFQTHLF